MRYRQLGPTGLRVSTIGFGGVPIMRIAKQQAVEVIHRALDLGINIIDTARGYRDSEEKIGLALRGRRHGVVVATKSTARDRHKMARDIDLSLKALNTDHIDLYQTHDIREGDLDTILGPRGAMEALLTARDQGKIGHIGLSGHRPDAVIPAIETGAFTTVQLPLNIVDYPLFKDALPAATSRGMGIIVMKPLCGGILKSALRALTFVLSHPVSTAIPGMATVAEVDENAAVGARDINLAAVDLEALEAEAEALGSSFCRRCGYCLPCPSGIEIPDIFRFERYHVSYFARDWAREQYEALDASVEDCLDCGECEQRCPYGLSIRDGLARAHRVLLGLDQA